MTQKSFSTFCSGVPNRVATLRKARIHRARLAAPSVDRDFRGHGISHAQLIGGRPETTPKCEALERALSTADRVPDDFGPQKC